MPFTTPTCVNGNMCPISRRQFKTEINYLDTAARQRLHDELLEYRLATYRYKAHDPAQHLGFMTDDVAPAARKAR